VSWDHVAIGEVADIVSGATPKSSVADYWGGEVAWATPTDLSKLKGKHLARTERTITRKGLSSCAAKVLPANSVLFSSRAPIGLVAINTEPMATNQGFKSFVPSDELDASFLFWWLKANRQRLEDLGTGATFKEVAKRVVSEVQIPLPPIDVQRRIAAILDKADAIRSKREQMISITDDLLRAAFLEMFGDPVLNTKQLPTAALGDIIKVSSGNGLTAKKMDPNGQFPVYGGNGVNGYHSEYMFEDPQIVIGRVGVYCGAVHVSQPKAWVTDNALYVREYRRPINHTYLEWALRFANLNQYAGRAAQPLISGSRIYPIEIVLPNNDMQDSFAAFVERQKKFEARLLAAHEDAESLFGSLSQRAFRGEL